MSVGTEIVTKFKFLGDLKPQQTFNANLGASIKALGAFAAASKIAAVGAFAWANSMFGPIDKMGNLAIETNNSAESMQQWNYVAEQNNSSAEALGQSMIVLTRRAGQYAKFGNGPAADAIKTLGLAVKNTDGTLKNSSDLMLDLSDKMQGLSEGEQLSMLRKLGIDRSMLQTLRMTREEIEEMQDTASKWGLVSQEDADAVMEYGGAMTELKYGLTAVQNTVAVGFAPMMTDMVSGFAAALKANKDWIVNGLKWLGGVIVSVSGFINRMWPVLAAIAAGFLIAKVAAIGFGTIMGVVFSPVVLITAAVLALLFIIDDLIVAFNGGQSVIADFFQEFFGIDIVPVLQGIVDVFKQFLGWIKDTMKPLISFYKNLFGAIAAVFKGDFSGAFDFVQAAFSDLGEYLMRLFDGVIAVLTGALNGLAEAFSWIGEHVSAVFKPVFDAISSMISAVSSLFKGDFGGAIDHIGDAFASLGEYILGIFTGAFNGIMGLWGKVAAYIKEKAMSMLPDWAIDLIGGAGSAVSDGVNAVKGAGSAVAGFFGFGDSASDAIPAPSESMGFAGAGAGSNSSVEQNIQMTVVSSDPQAAAAATAVKLQDSQQRAKALANRGGR